MTDPVPAAPIRLVVGGVPLRVVADRASLARRIAERYRGFDDETGGAPAFELALGVDAAASPPRLHPTWVDNPPIEATGTMERMRIAGAGFRGRLDWNEHRGSASIPDSLAHADLFIRIAAGVGLLRDGGTLLHAAAVVRDGFGLAFSGPSGAGKSTLADICRAGGLDVLADEMVAARPRGCGLRLIGTPFWSGKPRDTPFGGLFLLRKAAEPALERLPAARALPALLRAGGAPVDLRDVQHAFFRALSGLLRRVPAYELSFRPDASFWHAIDRQPEFSFWRPRRAAAGAPVVRLPAAGGAG